MARLTDYEQDEDKPFGYGTFRLDDGTEYYLDDPERARSFLEELEQQTNAIADGPGKLGKKDEYTNAVRKLAEGPGAEQIQPDKLFKPGRPDPYRGAVAGPGGGDESLMSVDPSSSAPNQSRAPEEELESREPPEPAPEPTPAELRELEQARRVVAATAGVNPYKITKGVDPRRMQTEGVPVDKNFSRKGGLPVEVYNQQAQDRADAHSATNATVARHYQEDEARAAMEIERLRGEALRQKQQNDARQLDIQRREQKYTDDRAWLQKEVDSYYDRSKPDPDGGLRKARGPVGNLASAIAQFMGAYAAIISGSPNFANQILNRKIDQHVDAQVEAFRRGKMKLDGQMARMAERGMSIEQMKSALKLQQELVVQKEVQARALAEGTREAKQAAESLLMDRQERFVTEENKFRTEALGETTVSGEMVQPVAPTRVRKSPLELELERAKLLEAQNKTAYEAGGGAAAERELDRELKREESGAKREESSERRRAEYGNKRGTLAPAAKEAQDAWDTIERIRKNNGGSLPGVGLFDVGRNAGSRAYIGGDYMKDAGEVRNAIQVLRDAAVRANAGTQTEGDVQRESAALEGEDLTEEQLLIGAQRLLQRATIPLIELDATYSDVKGRQDEERDRALLERHRKRKEDEERRRRAKDY